MYGLEMVELKKRVGGLEKLKFRFLPGVTRTDRIRN